MRHRRSPAKADNPRRKRRPRTREKRAELRAIEPTNKPLSRRHVLGALAGLVGLGAMARPAGAQVPMTLPFTLPTNPLEPTDEMLAMSIPAIDAALNDSKKLRTMVAQSERVFGARRLNLLAWKILCLKRPDLARRRVVGRAIRRNLGV